MQCEWESPKEKDHSEDPRRRWQDGIRMDLGETGWRVWSAFSWLKKGAVVNVVMKLAEFWLHGVSQSVSQLVS
jgi:hypothetical protein